MSAAATDEDTRVPFTRAELIKVLNEINISMPKNTKLSDALLRQRLKQALDALQAYTKASALPAKEPRSLPAWPADRKLLGVMGRTSLYEKITGQQDEELYKNVFTDLRQTVMSIGNAYDRGVRAVLVQDRVHKSCAIMLKVCVRASLWYVDV